MTIGIQQVRSFIQGKITEPLVKTMGVCGILARGCGQSLPTSLQIHYSWGVFEDRAEQAARTGSFSARGVN